MLPARIHIADRDEGKRVQDLLGGNFGVVNIGLARLGNDLREAGIDVIDLEWSPPAGGDPDVARMLADLADDDRDLGARIKAANQEALARLTAARPVLRDIVPAREVVPGMTDTTILHAGPPITWDEMCGAMRGAVIGGLLYEGLATTPAEAQALAAGGAITFAPCHSSNAVGPMAGVLTPRMPVLVVQDDQHGTIGYAGMNEGWGRTLRFGAFDDEVLERLRWMERVLAPSLQAAIDELGGIEVKPIIARALHMGDECHNRDLAATMLFFRTVAPALMAAVRDRDAVKQSLDFLANQEHFFLNVGMAACKASLLAAHGIPFSTMVTAIARNGVHVGIRTSGTEDTWFTTPASIPQGLYFPGYSEADANPDLGDSAITETAGIGAFAMASAPAIVRFVGGTPADALRYTHEMYQITLGENPNYTIPALDFQGTPTGIDVRAVLETGIAPVINTGIAHKEPGHGLVGAGVVRAPFGAFLDALRHMHATWVAGHERAPR